MEKEKWVKGIEGSGEIRKKGRDEKRGEQPNQNVRCVK